MSGRVETANEIYAKTARKFQARINSLRKQGEFKKAKMLEDVFKEFLTPKQDGNFEWYDEDEGIVKFKEGSI